VGLRRGQALLELLLDEPELLDLIARVDSLAALAALGPDELVAVPQARSVVTGTSTIRETAPML
jgi:hypothetical protein